jgi:hypothetical protein
MEELSTSLSELPFKFIMDRVILNNTHSFSLDAIHRSCFSF